MTKPTSAPSTGSDPQERARSQPSGFSAEVGNALSAPDNREVFLETLRSIRDQGDFEIVAATTGGL